MPPKFHHRYAANVHMCWDLSTSTYFIPSAAHTRDQRKRTWWCQTLFPAAARDPEPPPMCSSKPAGPSCINPCPLLTIAALRTECVVGGGVLVAADRGRAAHSEEEDGCAALAVQAGGIKEDRDQSPSAPSLRQPRPPDYKSVF